jgi:hypothetical protein
MKTTTLTKTTLPFAAVALLAATSQAAVINVDIQGNNSGGSVTNYSGASANGPIASDNTWNYFNTVGAPDAADTMTVSGVTFAFGGGWLSSFADGTPNNLQGDRVFTATGVTGTFTISGLDISMNYNLALIGPSNAAGGFGTDFTIGGDTKNATATGNPGSGNGPLTFTEGDSHVLFSGLDGSSGSITFTIIDDDADGVNGVLSGLQLESVAVPEPSTTALLGLGGLALILRRRK